MANIPEVKVKISGDSKGFEGAIKSTQGLLKRLGTDLSALQSLGAKALSFTGIGSAASVAGLLTAATNVAAVAKEISQLSLVSNTGVEEFQKLSAGAKTVGIDASKLADIFKDVQDKVGEFLQTGGGPLADFFKDIAPQVGVTAAQFRNLSGPDALQLYVSSLEKANLSQSQFTFFMEAIASDSARLLPLLRDNGAGFRQLGDEAQRLGGIISDELVKESIEFEKNLERLRTLSKGVATDIGATIIPALNRLASEYLAASTAGLSFFEALVGVGLSNPFRTAQQQVESLTIEIEKLQNTAAEGLLGSSPEEVAGADTTRLRALIKLREYYTAISKGAEKAEVDANVQKNNAIAKAEANLAAGVSKLKELQAKQTRAANEEELKGVERLKTALQSAWKASIDGAAKAREDAKALLTQAADARTAGGDAATERRSRSQGPEPKDESEARLQAAQKNRDASIQAERARSEANFAASGAVIAAFQGRLAESKKLSDQALIAAERATKLSESITDDNAAAKLLEQLGAIKADALKAQALVKEKEAKDLEEIGEKQNAQITKAEERIKVLKGELEKPVTITTEITAAQANIQTLKAELDKLQNKTITVTVNTATPGKTITNLDTGQTVDLPTGPFNGYATGGYTGPGGKFKPAGIVHAGEYVLRQEVVKQRGMRSLLDRLNLEGMSALGKRGYANGGLVGSAPTPINLQWPDGTTSRVSADRAVADEIKRTFRRASLSRGRRS